MYLNCVFVKILVRINEAQLTENFELKEENKFAIASKRVDVYLMPVLLKFVEKVQ
jgi:hypothetical protein